MISTFTYDGSWMGLCSCIFAVYEYKIPIVKISKEAHPVLFGEVVQVYTDIIKGERVLKGIASKAGKQAVHQAYTAFLSELPGIENIILRYIQYILKVEGGSLNVSEESVNQVQQIAKKVSRERHRMKAFTRFSLGEDGLYFASISPDFNVLPLIARHFKDRYADQRWLIYDSKRNYGLHYDLEKVTEVQLVPLAFNEVNEEQQVLNSNEKIYQTLWQQYFKSVNIKERKNTRLHLQHLPRRYWKYLTEKWEPE